MMQWPWHASGDYQCIRFGSRLSDMRWKTHGGRSREGIGVSKRMKVWLCLLYNMAEGIREDPFSWSSFAAMYIIIHHPFLPE